MPKPLYKQRLPAPVADRFDEMIYLLRGRKVMIDSDLAALYGVTTKALNQAVRRNLERFPEDFMFQLTPEEADILRSQFVTSSQSTPPKSSKKPSKSPNLAANLRSQIVTSSLEHGGRRHLPFVFTEQGVAMLSSVLRSARAVRVNISIMRTFVRLRQVLAANADLERRLSELEQRCNRKFKAVFDAIRELMTPPEPELEPRREIGFHAAQQVKEEPASYLCFASSKP